ncbi:MAG: addiction module toxin RelE [Hydrogenophilales bacterium CG_4_9_14_3_um_filter_63_34]|nr:MAG: addiction module toxin RelE [Hydrogenophilales bacterium CG_4_10_14_3_um_filter_63_21]PJB04778.1 MAG: addiction module toxin RelE [Hydrogenophilales bacterium CG_4_9_14_3_um_filter_63_34]
MNIVFRPSALDELAEIRNWYESHARGLGDAFMRSVQAALSQITRFPLASPRVDPDVRKTVLRKFPYALFHAVENDGVIVLGCVHQSRNPIHWPHLDH